MKPLEHIQQLEDSVATIASEGHLLSPDDYDVVCDITKSVHRLRKRFEDRIVIEEIVRGNEE